MTTRSFQNLLAELGALLPESLRPPAAERKGETPAEQFANWLPYRAGLSERQVFVNNGTLGFMLEVMPQAGADDRMVEVLRNLYTACPVDTGIQLHLFGSPQVRDALLQYANMRHEDDDLEERSLERGRPVRNNNLFRVLARQRVRHLLEGSQRSLTNGYHFTIRNFRLMVSVTLPGGPDNEARVDELCTLRASISTTLRAAALPNRVCDAADLINWCSMFVNADRMSKADAQHLHYDDGREIRDQVVDFDTIQDPHPLGLVLSKAGMEGELEVRFLSIKSFPERFKLWQMGGLIGDLMQPALQYSCPFLLTMGVHILDQNSSKAIVSANHIRATQNAGSKMAAVMPDVTKKLEDWTAMAKVIDEGGSMVSMYHQLALFAPSAKAAQAAETAKAIWRARGFELNADIYMARQALLASLPMTLSPAFHADLKKMRRVTRKSTANAVHLAPLIAEWRGTPTPILTLVGRRGQLASLDLYDNEGNYNAAVIGAPGSGKSVLLNEIAWSYLGVGAKVFMLDLGRSFEKLCRKARGTYIEFKPEVDICLNPFTNIRDINEDIDMLVPALAKMCSMSQPLHEVQYKAISTMILRLWEQYGQDMTVTALRDAFRIGTIEEQNVHQDQRIKDLAIMLNPYAKGGQYERFFEGKNNVDFTNDFIVIENEELKRKPDLHAVVNILLLYEITGEMYLTRNRKKLLMIDELKQQLGDIGSDDPVKAAVIEGAARRARKYGGSLVTATQAADDYYGSVQMEAAFNCSDWVFLLRQKPESLELLDRKGRLTMDPGKKRLLTSIRTEPGVFSEVYVSSPVGEGVMRVVLDPATNLLFSNKLEDNQPIDALRQQGHSIDEAITLVLKQRGVAL